MSQSEIDAWVSLTNDIKKVVIVDGHYSEPFQSICGAPEGDPLSVVASAWCACYGSCMFEKDANDWSRPVVPHSNSFCGQLGNPTLQCGRTMCCPTEILSFLWHMEITLDLQKSWSWGSHNSLFQKLQGLPQFVPKPVKVSRNQEHSSDTLMNNKLMNFSKKDVNLPISDWEGSHQSDSP